MGIFSRRTRDGPTAAGPNTTNGHGRTRSRAGAGEPYTMATRPSFGQWIKYTWLDLLTMVIMGAIGLGIYEAHPAPTRSFAVNFSDGEIVYPEFAYPLRKEIVPIWLAALLASIIPIFIILVMQIRIRSFWDVNNGIIGLLYALITAAVFQVFVKWLIGGLRPHFLAVCKPDISLASNGAGVAGSGLNGVGYESIYYTREICTGNIDDIDDSLESMPSGHTTAAFAGFVYLYLYLNAKLKVFSNYHPAMWKLIVLYAPLLGACLIGGALTIDEFHNWYDVFAGAVIGTVMAFSAYRMLYASIWDWRFNHIPLHRGMPFSFAGGDMELFGTTFTRRVGWGTSTGSFSERHGFSHGFGHGANNGTNSAGMSRKPVATGAGYGDNMV